MEPRFLELIVEINISSIKILVINKDIGHETKIIVLYKNVYHDNIIDSHQKKIINLKNVKEWLQKTIDNLENQLRTKFQNVLVVVCDLGFKLLMIEKTYHYTTDKFSHQDNKILLERMKVLNNSDQSSIINMIPLRFEVDKTFATFYAPINTKINKLIKIKALCYLLNKGFINDIKVLFHAMDLNIKSIMSESVGLAYEQSAIEELKKHVILCNVGTIYSKVAINYHEIIRGQETIKVGSDQIIKDINYFLNCGFRQAKAIFNLYGFLSINFQESLNDKVIYTRYFPGLKREVIYKVEFLTKVINARVLEIITKLINRSKNWTNIKETLFIFSGSLIKIQNFEKFINYHFPDLNIRLYESKIIGVTKNDFSAILGNVYYYNNKNFINIRLAKKINHNENKLKEIIEQLNSV